MADSSSIERRSNLMWLAVALCAYVGLWYATPAATFIPRAVKHLLNLSHGGIATLVIYGGAASVLAALPTVLFMACQFSSVYYYARLGLKWTGLLAVMVVCAGAALLVLLQMSDMLRESGRTGVVPNSALLGLLRMPLSLLIIGAASSLGALVSIRVTDKNLLLPVAMFAAAIDFWTVNFGPTKLAITAAPGLVAAVSAPIPTAGAGGFVPSTMIGPGDFLFTCLMFAAVYRFGLDSSKNFWYVFCAMSAGMMAVMFNVVGFLPALTVLAVAILLANWREFHLSRQEKVSTLIVGVVLAASVPLVWFMIGKPGAKDENPNAKPPAVNAPARRK